MLTRRAFVSRSAVLAAPQRRASAQPAGPRNLLTSRWTPDQVAARLLPREQYQPFRDGWDAVPEDARAALIASGERALKGTWEVLPAGMALEFARNGNRSRYEALRNRRRNRLQELVVAERLEGKGHFTDEIANGVWLTCEETFWGVPAHLGAQKAGVGLPDVAEPIVDLFAAETAGLLAWTLYLLEGALSKVSPLIPERIRLEAGRRVLTPAQTRDFSWMGFSGHSVNNWDPWICSNWLTAALLVERDETRRGAAVYRILRCLDNFLNSYAGDGGCDEGPSYWGRAGASLFDCLDLLHQASGGALNGFDLPLVHQIGLYICRAHIAGEWYTNFSDAPARVFTNGDLVYRFGKRLNDDAMKKHGAFAAFLRDEHGLPGDSIGRQLPALFDLAELRRAPRAQALLRDAWMAGIGVMAARRQEGSTQGLYLAAEAGNNGKSHNHNDVGNFVVYANGQPAIIDVGVETYTAKTFSPQRYEIWTMQSAFHNCPTIDGVMQSAGRQFSAGDVSYHADDEGAELRSNLAAAYPPQAHLERWVRSVRLDRTRGDIELVDGYALTGPAKIITLTLMTPCHVTQQGPGKLSLEGTLQIAYDAALTPAIEEVELEDGQLRNAWGEKLYRVLLRAENPPARGKWITRFSPAT
ncbi:MAG: heparinase II/III family protein [Candidatus Sulfopaludibacter sp.]|nr:heparinase II/III family protein [Candidatus Sulfopaludibacter sp.]